MRVKKWIGLVLCLPMLIFGGELRKKALIFGVTGQDGSYLCELLLSKDYEVHGVKRRASTRNTERLDHIYQAPHTEGRQFFLHYGDVTDSCNVLRLVQEICPDEIYNLSAQSHVAVSFEIPEYTAEVDALGTLRILEAIRMLGLQKKIKFYQASTSEMFGEVQEIPQKETTPFHPRSPYGVAKVFSYWATINYREAYGIYACNGILFNHESPKRGETFVTRKITQAVARIKYGLQDKLFLGNMDACRDWGYAKDYVEAMWLMLQQEEPVDYVIGTGETHTVREFAFKAFNEAGIEIEWQGFGISEIGIDKATKKVVIEIDPKYFRPAEVDYLLADPTKAREKLGWAPTTSFDELVKLMVTSDLEHAKKEYNNLMRNIGLNNS